MSNEVGQTLTVEGAKEAAEAFERLATALKSVREALEGLNGKHGGVEFKMAGPLVTCTLYEGGLLSREDRATEFRSAVTKAMRA